MLGKRGEEIVAGAEGGEAEVRACKEQGGDCSWRGREGSPGTRLGKEGRRVQLDGKGRGPRYVPR